MAKRKISEKMVIVAAALTFTAFTVLFVLALLLQDIGAISSTEIDDTLYARLDEYNLAIRETEGVATIITTAESSPDRLTDENRLIYLAYQRTFFDGWEAAWTYNDAGSFDADRWNEWNTWYVREVRRRPQFGWTENRKYYSGAFLRHVDESIRNP